MIGVSASASVLSMNIQSWFPLGLAGLIFLHSPYSMAHSLSKLAFSANLVLSLSPQMLVVGRNCFKDMTM